MIAFLVFADRSRARRPAIRTARRDVSGIRHFGREGGRHGGGRAGAVSRDDQARQQGRRPRRRCCRPRRVMSETIPPSIVLITVGSVTGVSIAALFTGGLLPAVVGMHRACGRRVRATQERGHSTARRASRWRTSGKLFLIALPGLGLPFVIRTAVVEGDRDRDGSLDDRHRLRDPGRRVHLSPVRLAPRLPDAGRDGLAVGRDPARRRRRDRDGVGADAIRLLAPAGGPDGARCRAGKVGFLLVSAIAFIVLGSVLEGVPAIVLFGPLLFPIARADRRPRGALRDGGRCSRWGSGCSRRRSASASISPARSDGSRRMSPSDRSGRIWPRCSWPCC